ncbi:MAG: hypothetical protein EXS33_03880 [Pedosphaera sp.]|nr:hypothetical protein [Pedosphaera sp.]
MFFIIPVGVDYRAYRYPVVTFTLIGINVVLFLASLFHGPITTVEDVLGFWYFDLALSPANGMAEWQGVWSLQ